MKRLALAIFLFSGSAQAGLLDWEERRRVILEMEQVNRGDYSYQVETRGTIRQRCDRSANQLRRTRDPSTLLFPTPCGPEARPARYPKRSAR